MSMEKALYNTENAKRIADIFINEVNRLRLDDENKQIVIDMILEAIPTLRLTKPTIENTTKLCAFCEGETVLTRVLKQRYICTKCGAEGETLVRWKEEEP